MTYYLYKKTHNQTGLKYLGKTETDPYTYKGSGTRWNNHLSVHGNDVSTEILRECESNDEIRYWGEYYSNLWNVVESDEWANLKAESGDGGVEDSNVELTVSTGGAPREPLETVAGFRLPLVIIFE